jgi:hypothetical protein
MSSEIPTFAEAEKLDTMTSFWLTPSVSKRFAVVCKLHSIDRSKILRLLVKLFLNDSTLQKRVLRGIRNNV